MIFSRELLESGTDKEPQRDGSHNWSGKGKILKLLSHAPAAAARSVSQEGPWCRQSEGRWTLFWGLVCVYEEKQQRGDRGCERLHCPRDVD